MKYFFSIIFISVFFLTRLSAQSIYNDSESNKNDIVFSITPNPFWGFAGFNFEKRVTEYKRGSIFGEAGLGYWQTWGAGGWYYRLKINNRLGKGSHHFEAGLGTQVHYDMINYKYRKPDENKLNYTDFYLAASAGYLYNKPQGKFLFKVGFAWPESLYLGFGYAF